MLPSLLPSLQHNGTKDPSTPAGWICSRNNASCPHWAHPIVSGTFLEERFYQCWWLLTTTRSWALLKESRSSIHWAAVQTRSPLQTLSGCRTMVSNFVCMHCRIIGIRRNTNRWRDSDYSFEQKICVFDIFTFQLENAQSSQILQENSLGTEARSFNPILMLLTWKACIILRPFFPVLDKSGASGIFHHSWRTLRFCT